VPIDKLLPDEVSLPRAIAQVLEEAGIDLIFGSPGGRTGAIFVALYDYRDSTRIVLVREEGLAAVMADVYGRLTGKPGVAMGQGAFVLTNSGMGILEAFLAGSPRPFARPARRRRPAGGRARAEPSARGLNSPDSSPGSKTPPRLGVPVSLIASLHQSPTTAEETAHSSAGLTAGCSSTTADPPGRQRMRQSTS
jgi:Thiamine pyrophosphate enzyme, N-terminal TPP binding domain